VPRRPHGRAAAGTAAGDDDVVDLTLDSDAE
jgi:hypothetical protein